MLLRGKLESGRGGPTFRVRARDRARRRTRALGPPHDRPRAGLSRHRGPVGTAHPRAGVGAARPASVHALEPLPARAARRGGAWPARPTRSQPRTGPSRSRRCPSARRRLAFEELFLFQLALVMRRRTRSEAREAEPLGAPGDARASSWLDVPAVRAHGRAAQGARGDRRGPRHGPADAAPADGRGRVRQDRRRPVRDAAGRGGGHAGRADGAHRDARRAALRDDPRA